VDVADFDNDGDMDIVSGSSTPAAYEVMVWENIGAQVTETVTDTSPSGIGPGLTDDVLKVNVTHNGISSDNSIQLTTWRFKFFSSDGTTPLTNTDLKDTIANHYIYLDDGDGSWSVSDTLVTTVVTNSSNEIRFNFTDVDPNVNVSHGTPRDFFYVVQVSASPTIYSFRVEFDPDGYGINDYNEIEDNVTDKRVSIQETNGSMTDPVDVPEFPGLFIVMAMALFSIILIRRRKGISKRGVGS